MAHRIFNVVTSTKTETRVNAQFVWNDQRGTQAATLESGGTEVVAKRLPEIPAELDSQTDADLITFVYFDYYEVDNVKVTVNGKDVYSDEDKYSRERYVFDARLVTVDDMELLETMYAHWRAAQYIEHISTGRQQYVISRHAPSILIPFNPDTDHILNTDEESDKPAD